MFVKTAESDLQTYQDDRIRLRRVQVSDPRYHALRDLFLDNWKHPMKVKPNVRAIYQVLSPSRKVSSYLKYRSNVAASGTMPSSERLLFHGTTRLCSIADDFDNLCPCMQQECSLCCIIRTSFDVNKCGKKHRFKRFGKGIYTTSCSSKADDYVSGRSGEPSKSRVTLLNSVIVGNPLVLYRSDMSMTEPPPGYHSVVGAVGAHLKYDETVVYTNDAIIPLYLIVYNDGLPIATLNPLLRLKSLFKTPLAS